MITTAATNPIVTAAGDLVFMAAYTDRFQGRVMAQFASETLGVTTAAFLTQRGDVYAEGIAEFFATSFRGFRGTIVAEEFYESGATDLSGGVGPHRCGGPRRPLSAGPPARKSRSSPGRLVPSRWEMRTGNRRSFSGRILGTTRRYSATKKPQWTAATSAPTARPDTDEPGARAFVDRYRALYGAAPSGGDGVNYDAVRLFVEAVERAGTLDADAVRQQLAVTEDYAGATRIARYDEDRHPTKSAVIMSIRDGAKTFFRQVNP